MQHFADEKHAWVSGLVVGHLIKNGLEISVHTDDEGNWTPTFDVLIPDLEEFVTLRVCNPDTEEAALAVLPEPTEQADFTLSFRALPGQDAEEAYHALSRDLGETYGLEEIG